VKLRARLAPARKFDPVRRVATFAIALVRKCCVRATLGLDLLVHGLPPKLQRGCCRQLLYVLRIFFSENAYEMPVVSEAPSFPAKEKGRQSLAWGAGALNRLAACVGASRLFVCMLPPSKARCMGRWPYARQSERHRVLRATRSPRHGTSLPGQAVSSLPRSPRFPAAAPALAP